MKSNRLKVIEYYPTAHAVYYNPRDFPIVNSWRIYYRLNKTPWNFMIGMGNSEQEAWKSAWQAVQRTMIEKLERE